MLFRIQVFSQLIQQQQQNPMGMIGSVFGSLLGFALGIVELVAMWKVFTKANQPGWAVLIPIYNLYVLLEIVGRPWWWLLLFLIPGVNVIIAIILMFDLAKSFGKGAGFGLGLLLLNFIFILILAFGDAQYVGPVASE
jgi:hypothetical protein